ncbi:MAG: GNAT family N-acetyltransferase [Bacteroidia bacterium]
MEKPLPSYFDGISTGKEQMDFDMILNYLSGEAYWAKGRTPEQLQKIMDSSLCFGIFENGRQAGFARVVTDYVTIAYLADVFVLSEFRGKGYGRKLMQYVLNYPDFEDVRKWLLMTKDAHLLYERFGFRALQKPEMAMEMVRYL